MTTKERRLWITAASLVGILSLVVIGTTLYLYRSFLPVYIDNYMPVDQAARILVFDRTTGGRVLNHLISLGDDGLRAVQAASEDFEHLDNRNSLWVARLLASIDSPLSVELSRELYQRASLRQKLVGAVGVVAHHGNVDASFVEWVQAHPRKYQDDEDLASMILQYRKTDTSTNTKP